LLTNIGLTLASIVGQCWPNNIGEILWKRVQYWVQYWANIVPNIYPILYNMFLPILVQYLDHHWPNIGRILWKREI